MKKLRVILYCRVSTDEQAKHGFSLEEQENRLIQLCSYKGYEVAMIFRENCSAKTFNRKKWKELRAFIKGQNVNLILVTNWSRFSRNISEALAQIDYFKKKNIEINAMEQWIDFNIPESLNMLAIYLATPEVENRRKSIATRGGMIRAKELGGWTGTPPFGYSLERQGKLAVLVPNENAETVKEIFDLYGTGNFSISDIRKHLKKKGVNKSKQAVINILRNVAYVGKIFIANIGDEPEHLVEGRHQALLDEDLFNKVQDVFSGKRRRHKRKDTSMEYPLKGTLICSTCGRKLTASGSLSRLKNKYHYYHCTITKGHDRFGIEKVHSTFQTLLSLIKVPPEVASLYEAIFETEYNRLHENLSKDLADIDASIARVQARLTKTEDDRADDILDIMSYRTNLARYRAEESRLIMKRTTLQADLIPIKKEINYAISLINNLGRLYAETDAGIRAALIGSIFPNSLQFEEGSFRTKEVNSLFELLVLNTNELGVLKIEKSHFKSGLSSKAPPVGDFDSLEINSLQSKCNIFDFLIGRNDCEKS